MPNNRLNILTCFFGPMKTHFLRYFSRSFHTSKYHIFTRLKYRTFTQQKYQTFVVLQP
jgi:hypothetical protein